MSIVSVRDLTRTFRAPVREAGLRSALGSLFRRLVMLRSGSTLAWASRVFLASLAFWAPVFQPDVLYQAVWQSGRYPVSIYRQPIRFALTYVVPMAFIATFAVQALTCGVSPVLFALSLALGIGAILTTRRVWNAGLRRYTSATS